MTSLTTGLRRGEPDLRRTGQAGSAPAPDWPGPLSRLSRFLDGVQGIRADGIAFLAGVLTASALPPFFVLPAILVGFSVLLRLVDAAPGKLVAGRRGFAFATGIHCLGLTWLTNAILTRVDQFWWVLPFATPLTAVGLAPFAAIPVALARAARRGTPRWLALAGLWTLGDIAREFVFTGFPWNPLGSVLEWDDRFGDVMIQAGSLAGVYGLTLAVVLVAASPAAGRTALAIAALLVAGDLGFGFWRLGLPAPHAPGLDVVLVQGNVSETAKLATQDPLTIFRRYLALTHEGVAAAGDTPSVVAWPETASPYTVVGDPPATDAIAAAARPALASFVGTIRFDAQGRPRNSLVAVLPDGSVGAIYDKTHLVPFGEYTPSVMPFQVVPGGGLAAGDGRKTLRVAGVPPLSPLICYEVIFSGEVTKPGDRPAWLLNITNDAWFGDSPGPRQHLEAARMRAVEEGLPLARAANTGISVMFDARGHETGRLGYGRTGVLTRPLGGRMPATPFGRVGIGLPVLLALLASAGAFLPTRGGIRSSRLDNQRLKP